MASEYCSFKQALAQGLPRCRMMLLQVSAQAQGPDQSTPGPEPTNSTLRGLLIRIKPDDNPKAPTDGIPARIETITDAIISKACMHVMAADVLNVRRICAAFLVLHRLSTSLPSSGRSSHQDIVFVRSMCHADQH
jgi:hypothetical protein